MKDLHTQEDFKRFMSQLKETNASLAFYSDFGKIAHNVNNIAISLNMLNFLLGKKNLREAVEALWERDKSAFDVMDILIAIRQKDKKKFLDADGNVRLIHSLFQSVDGVMEFLVGTGLDQVFIHNEIKDLVDYVFGIETGLDSNARKNRSGKIVEEHVAHLFSQAGIKFKQQVPSNLFPDISQVLGADRKVFDFVITTASKTYLIEVNFYSGGGSKLNEVARSYTDVAPKVNSVNGYEFVWITDGIGWHSASNKLEEAYYSIPRVYNLTSIKQFIEEVACDE